LNTALAHSAPVSPGATCFPTDKCFIAGREKGFEALYGFSALKTVAAWRG
jgi:hypothetical protein